MYQYSKFLLSKKKIRRLNKSEKGEGGHQLGLALQVYNQVKHKYKYHQHQHYSPHTIFTHRKLHALPYICRIKSIEYKDKYTSTHIMIFTHNLFKSSKGIYDLDYSKLIFFLNSQQCMIMFFSFKHFFFFNYYYTIFK